MMFSWTIEYGYIKYELDGGGGGGHKMLKKKIKTNPS